MQTKEPDSRREATERLVKILDSTYAKTELKQVYDDATHMNAEERTQLLRLHKYFEEFLNGSLVYWETQPADLELKPGSKPFN